MGIITVPTSVGELLYTRYIEQCRPQTLFAIIIIVITAAVTYQAPE